MQLFYCLFFSILFSLPVYKCKSIISQNDTALELLNSCKCVSKEYCYKGFINKRGVGIIQVRDAVNDSETVETIQIQCSKPSFTCCKEWKDEFGTRTNTTFSSYKKDGKSTTLMEKEADRKVKAELKCGKPRPAINVRIYVAPDEVGTALDGEFPWIAAIHRKNALDCSFQFRCAGSLISDSVILTAAHCVYSSRKRPSELRIVANAKKELKRIGESVSEERGVRKILVHPEYYSGGAHNDIALVFLEGTYEESEKLNSICFPGKDAIFDKNQCIVAGWGEGNTKVSDGMKVLSKVEVPIIEQEKCESLLRKTKLGANFNLHESSICAGGKFGKDACAGDGGGPLICPNEEGYFYQVGIVSWGVDCYRENTPGVYTKVEKFVEWIQSNL